MQGELLTANLRKAELLNNFVSASIKKRYSSQTINKNYIDKEVEGLLKPSSMIFTRLWEIGTVPDKTTGKGSI